MRHPHHPSLPGKPPRQLCQHPTHLPVPHLQHATKDQTHCVRDDLPCCALPGADPLSLGRTAPAAAAALTLLALCLPSSCMRCAVTSSTDLSLTDVLRTSSISSPKLRFTVVGAFFFGFLAGGGSDCHASTRKRASAPGPPQLPDMPAACVSLTLSASFGPFLEGLADPPPPPSLCLPSRSLSCLSPSLVSERLLRRGLERWPLVRSRSSPE